MLAEPDFLRPSVRCELRIGRLEGSEFVVERGFIVERYDTVDFGGDTRPPWTAGEGVVDGVGESQLGFGDVGWGDGECI